MENLGSVAVKAQNVRPRFGFFKEKKRCIKPSTRGTKTTYWPYAPITGTMHAS